MQLHFRNNNSNELIILLDGWGMDETPYQPLTSSRDVLFINDYAQINLDFDFSNYKKIHLICFSAGVFMAGYLNKLGLLPKIDFSVAINGTLTPGINNHGVEPATIDEMRNISFETALDFRKKLILKEEHIELFNKNQPKRSLESSLNELDALLDLFKKNIDNHFEFKKVILGENDEIIPLQNSLRSWKDCKKHKNTHIIEGGHFMFYNFNSLDELID